MTRTYTAGRREIASLRQGVQRIGIEHGGAEPRPAAPDDTVRSLLAMQAQDFAGAKWSVGLRTPGSTDAAIESALATGTIVRSWPMRGTLHFTAPEDLGWMLSVTAPRTIRAAAGRDRVLQLTEPELERARELALAALSGGRALPRDDLLALFADGGVPVTGQRGTHILQRLCLWRVLVFGPLSGKQHTFVLFDEWIPRSRERDHDEALGEFAARYFAGHGPATVRDFAWWASLTLADARRGVEIARGELDEIDVDGTAYLLARDARAAASAVHALPGFDEYLLGYQDRGAALAREHAELVVPGKNGLFLPTIVVDGEVAGTWRRTVNARGVRVEAQPFAPLSARVEAGFSSAALRYARFLQRPLLATDEHLPRAEDAGRAAGPVAHRDASPGPG
jgi:hypothetical protein